jgi:NADPH:quinone reductase-like Zn-dependent oxidoreductase
LRQLGVDHPIDYTTGNTVEQVRALGHPVTVVFDCAGGEAQEHGWELIERDGRFVSIVSPPGDRGREKNVKADYVFVAPNGEQLAKIGDLIDAAVVKIPEITVKSVKEAAAAQDENQKRHVRGKVALRVDL